MADIHQLQLPPLSSLSPHLGFTLSGRKIFLNTISFIIRGASPHRFPSPISRPLFICASFGLYDTERIEGAMRGVC